MSVALAVQHKAAEISDVYDADYEQERLAVIFESRYTAMLKAVHELVASAFPEVEDFRLNDAATNRLLVEAGQRVVRIDETTRAAIAEQLRIGNERGYSTWEIAHGVPKDGYPGIDGLYRETWAGRANTIARTELQHAQVESAIDRYAATGLVDRLKLIDGDQDPDCAARNGKTVPLSARPGLAHPNCTLVVVPVLKAGVR